MRTGRIARFRRLPSFMSTRPGGQPEATTSAPVSAVRAVFLVGFMGAGKSTVGLALSRKLGWAFEDLDDHIQARERRSIEQIFEQSGEAAFRQAEHAALRALIGGLGASSPTVVAVGGGAFAQANNAALLDETGFSVIFLDAPVEELFRRCQEQKLDRPLRRNLEEFRRLYESRRSCYMKAAVRIETGGKDVEEVAAEVVQSLGLLKG
jgi:shikimate kinase